MFQKLVTKYETDNIILLKIGYYITIAEAVLTIFRIKRFTTPFLYECHFLLNCMGLGIILPKHRNTIQSR